MLLSNDCIGTDFEVKNRKTGKIYWLSKKGIDILQKEGLINRFIVQQLKSLKTEKSPIKDFKLVVKNEGRGTKDTQ
jgi:hypothetical protein